MLFHFASILAARNSDVEVVECVVECLLSFPTSLPTCPFTPAVTNLQSFQSQHACPRFHSTNHSSASDAGHVLPVFCQAQSTGQRTHAMSQKWRGWLVAPSKLATWFHVSSPFNHDMSSPINLHRPPPNQPLDLPPSISDMANAIASSPQLPDGDDEPTQLAPSPRSVN